MFVREMYILCAPISSRSSLTPITLIEQQLASREHKRSAPSGDETAAEQHADKKPRKAAADEEGALVESAKLSFGRVELGAGLLFLPNLYALTSFIHL